MLSTNELEAMLAVQMVACHHLSMLMAMRTGRAEQIPQFEANGRMMTKFSRTFVAQMIPYRRCAGEASRWYVTSMSTRADRLLSRAPSTQGV